MGIDLVNPLHDNSQKQVVGLGPLAPFLTAWRNRTLVLRLARREIEARYRGSFLGLFWSVLTPVFMLCVYTFVFFSYFSGSLGDGHRRPGGHFALILFIGLIMFNFFAECMIRAPQLMLANASYIKKVVFPLEILPWVAIFVALFNAAIAFCVFLVGYLILIGAPPLTIFYLPLIAIPLVMLTLGLTLLVSSVGVFVRDLQQLVSLLVTVLMFLSPLFYPISALPVRYQSLVKLSPLTIAIEEARTVLFSENNPNYALLGIYLCAAWLVAWVGFVWFMKTRRGFADVL